MARIEDVEERPEDAGQTLPSDKVWTERAQKLIIGLASGHRPCDLIEATGINRSTFFRFRRRPDVMRVVTALQDSWLHQAVAQAIQGKSQVGEFFKTVWQSGSSGQPGDEQKFSPGERMEAGKAFDKWCNSLIEMRTLADLKAIRMEMELAEREADGE